MPETVYLLTEAINRSAYALAVFADRTMALDAARFHATHRIARCQAMDAKTFSTYMSTGTYTMVVNERSPDASVSIVHHHTGERDVLVWQIQPFEVVQLTSVDEGEQPDLFVLTT